MSLPCGEYITLHRVGGLVMGECSNRIRLVHVVKHSPTGLEWGYGGSGPADLALSVLTHWYGREIAEKYYMAFKTEYISNIPRAMEEWVIEKDFVDSWIIQWTNRKNTEEKKIIFNPVLPAIPKFYTCPICGKEFVDQFSENKTIGNCTKCGATFRR